VVDGVPQPNFLGLKPALFAEEMFKAVDEWDDAMRANVDVQKEKAKLLVIRPPGVTISGIQFG
jgi:hypothetical protein